MQTFVQISIGFARAGVLGYGGGPSVIPLIEHEAVKNYQWMSSDEFGETLALANTLPGPIATKMAAYVGYKVKGSMGAVVAILAHILPSLAAMIGLLSFLYSFRDSPFISGMVQGVTPVIAIMLLMMALGFLKKASNGLGMKWMALMLIIGIILLEILLIHPGIVIALFLSAAFIYATYKVKNNVNNTQKEKDVQS
ncbi:chromate transporter [Alteribacillus persepolensis]|uniref:Chromate transporter n=1 Tax=Alteribacillus persepolensis TaxID=568899 RepID=A0A1G8A4D5_9BACI|nr:chromate transporter [Alteribacillus persepolensis]SDH15727.1 chromate transporter [Alteribacillus persepolensis]